MVKSWLSRYFVLKDGVLSYYKDQQDFGNKQAAGHIDMVQVLVVNERPDIGSKKNLFEIVTATRSYNIQAENRELRTQWIESLRNEMKKFALT